MRSEAGAIIVVIAVLAGAGCPEVAGCGSDGDCPDGYHCDVGAGRCTTGNPATITGSSSIGMVASSSWSAGVTSSSSSVSSSSAPVSSSSSRASSSSTAMDGGAIVLTGGFDIGPMREARLTGGFRVTTRSTVSANDGMTLEGGFQ